MTPKYTAAALAMTMALVGLSQRPAAADDTFHITQRIYGYHKVGEPQPVATPTPAPAQPVQQALPSPQPIAQPGPAANTTTSQQQPVAEPGPSAAPSTPETTKEAKKETAKHVKEAHKPVEQPKAQVATPEQPAEQPASEQAGVPVAVPQQPAVTTSDQTIHINAPVGASSQPGLVKEAVHPESGIENVQMPDQTPPASTGDEVTPTNTTPEDADNQPQRPTPAEEADALKPAKNEALFKEALTHYNEAIHLNQQGQFKEAVVEYQKALYIDPAMPDARVGLAVSYASLGQWQPMINELQMALQLKDMFLDKFNLVQAHYNLSAAYCVQQDSKRAHEELDLVKEAHHPNLQQLQMFIDSHCAGK